MLQRMVFFISALSIAGKIDCIVGYVGITDNGNPFFCDVRDIRYARSL